MAKADLKAVIDADATKFDREIDKVLRDMERLNREIGRSNREADALQKQLNDRTAKALNNMGRGMVTFGAATLAGLGLATKAAIDWEMAWTGVLKTVDGSSKQLDKLQADLRGLATRLPASHQEIAAVAEAAGQLGVATKDVAGFTEVMINLGETTNLTAEAAATSIAQMMNVMQTAPEDVGRLGSALVELGNNGASTEAEIIDMAQRISGAGATVGLAEHEVLALSNALASAGISAESGGTSVSTAIVKMASAVAGGTEDVEAFAETAGMSAEQFSRSFEEEPAEAINAFVKGLGRVDAAGGNVFAVLDDLGLGSIRTRDAMLRMANSGDLLTQSLDDGERAWSENTALIEEAEKRYDTAEAKIGIAKNTLIDLAIDVGNVLLPVIAEMAEMVATVAKWFGNLPGPVKTVATVLALLAGAASLTAGAFLLVAPRLAAARTELAFLKATSPGAAAGIRAAGTAMGFLAKAAGVAGILFTVVQIMDQIDSSARKTVSGAGQATEAILAMSEGLRKTEFDAFVGEIDKFHGEFVLFRDTFAKFEDDFGAFDQALVSLVQNGQADLAAEQFDNMREKLRAVGVTEGDIEKAFAGYTDALAQVRVDNQLAAESVAPLDKELADLATRFGLTGDDAEEAAQGIIDSWTEAGTEFVSVLDAYNTALASKEEKEREAAQATADATEKTTDSWEDYVGDVKLSVDEYITQLKRMVKNQRNWRDNLIDLSGRVSDQMLDHLVQLGPEGADLVAMFADMTDKELSKTEKLWSKSTDEAVRGGIIEPVLDAGPVLAKIAADHGKKTANQVRDYMKKHGVGVEEAARKLGVGIDKKLRDGEDRKIPIKVLGGDVAQREIEEVGASIKNLPLETKLKIGLSDPTFNIGGKASGGPITGAGGPRDDKAGLYALSNGEHIWTAREVANAGGHTAVKALRARFAGGEGGPSRSGLVTSRIIPKFEFAGIGSKFSRLTGSIAERFADKYRSSTGKVLPPGSYRIGRGPEGHGYNARDLPAATGTPIFAAAAGVVSRALRLATSYGIHAVIQHAGWRSLYAHMSQMFVRQGQAISPGQQIGRVGSTGNSTGPHLHLEPDNPRLYHNGGVVPGPRGRTTPILAAGGEGVFTPDQMAAMGGRRRAEDGSWVPASFYRGSSGSGGPGGRLGDIIGRRFVKRVVRERDKINSVFDKVFQNIAEINKKSLRLDLREDAKRTRRELRGWGRELERVHNRLDKARGKLKDIRRDAREMRRSIRSDIATADILNPDAGTIAGRSGALEVTGTATFKSITDQMKRERDQAHRFADAIRKLRRRGLNKRALQSIVEAGPEEGLATARAIVGAGRGGVIQMNKLQRSLNREADRIGKMAAGSMFNAGIQSARGFVRGLEKNERRIKRSMRRIARSLVRELRRELRMSSPSKVMEDLGVDTVAGYIGGLDKQRHMVERSAADLAGMAAAGAQRWLVGTQNPAGSPVGNGGAGGVMEFRHTFVGRGGSANADVDRLNYLLRTGQVDIKTEAIRR